MSITIAASMPGVVNKVNVEPGSKIEEGDVVLIMDSMKMHVPIESTHAGTVETVHVNEGDEVAEDGPLVTLATA